MTSYPLQLRLDDGTTWTGTSFGSARPVAGEVVFATAMNGYVEALTDPAYRGQILVMTYPLVGGYGVPAPRSAQTIDPPYESDRIQVQGLIVTKPIERFSHHTAVRSLGEWLAAEGVTGIAGIDTRALTIHLRAHGTIRGRITLLDKPDDAADEVVMSDVAALVAPREIVRYEGGPRRVLVVDAGAKDNLVRSLLARGVSVVRAPFTAELEPLAREADGIVIGSGPGDPKSLTPLIAQVRTLLGSSSPRPILGVCLGNQILALAAGGDTAKMPYGHRGVNQPVRDLATGRCYITSQNHGYAVVDGSLPSGWMPWFVNANDGTNEGVRAMSRPFFSVQFHPEAHPGPDDTGFVFDNFIQHLNAP